MNPQATIHVVSGPTPTCHCTRPQQFLTCAGGTLIFNPSNYLNSRPDGFGVLEIVTPESPARTEPVVRYFVPLRATEARGEIAGPLAQIELFQTFAFSRQTLDQTIEALYRFPLPGDAAITGVTVRFGDVEISAVLKPRAEAEAGYAKARAEGSQATLLMRETADVFTLQITGIKPDEEVQIRTTYTQLARGEGESWALRIPLTTAPRYVRDDEANSPHSQGQPLAVLRDPGHRFRLHLAFPEKTEVASPTHDLAVSTTDAGRLVELAGGAVLPDRDCVLRWQMAHDADATALQLFRYDDMAGGYTYFLAQTRLLELHADAPGHRREIVLLVDHSGSMSGAKWEAADWAVARFLRSLRAEDTFALAVFHNHTTWFAGGALHQAEDPVVANAIEWLKARKDSGGTELGVALEQALAVPRTNGAASRHVLILTDSEVTDAGRILRLAGKEAASAERRRISALCIDAAPNAFLAQELAERGGGVARFLTSNPDDEDITTALDQVLMFWGEPVMIGASLAVNRPDVEAAGRSVKTDDGHSLIDVGDLSAGQTQWVCGRARLAAAPPLEIGLAPAAGEIVASTVAAGNGKPMPAIKSLFGARRVNGLEYLMTAGYSQATLRAELERLGYNPGAEESEAAEAVYAENAMHDAEKIVNRLLVRASLEYGVPSSATAFVAVRTEKGERVAGTVAVANALPAGWSEAFISTGRVHYRGRSMRSPLGVAAAPMPSMNIMNDPMLAMSATYAHGPIDVSENKDAGANWVELFDGALREASQVLFDSRQGNRQLSDAGTLTGLRVACDAAVAPAMAGAVTLLLYVGDLATPRARVSLADLLPAERPLNLRRRAGEAILLVAEHAAGTSLPQPILIKVALCLTP